MGSTVDIYQRLQQDHEKQRDLAAKIMETSGDSEERHRLFTLFKQELDAHALAEEQVFYAELMEIPEGTEKARHSVAEHKEADDLLEELCELDMGSGGWIHKFDKLQHKVVHHVDEEEDEVFPLAAELIDPARGRELASEFDVRKRAEAQ